MPLIVMCGIPCSGKTLRAEALLEHFSKTCETILIKDDETNAEFIRNEIYADSQKEKEMRSVLKSQVERNLSKDTVVIVDSGNYIKGCRYEFYCLSKGCKTTCCVVHCDLLPADCFAFNSGRSSPEKYDRTIFYEMGTRFESPDSRNRWDAPLFTCHKDEETPFQAIEDALFQRKAPPPNLATQCQPLSTSTFLYDMDRLTQDIVKEVLRAQNFCITGDQIAVPKADKKVSLSGPVSASDLARIRRQFISYTRSHPVEDSRRIPNMFVQFLNKSIDV